MIAKSAFSNELRLAELENGYLGTEQVEIIIRVKRNICVRLRNSSRHAPEISRGFVVVQQNITH